MSENMRDALYVGAYGALIGVMAATVGIYVTSEPGKFFLFIICANGIVALLRSEIPPRVIRPTEMLKLLDRLDSK
jgi:hypothetical protein